jgi:hypothetical protein
LPKFILSVAQYILDQINLAPVGGVSYTAERQLPNVKSYTAAAKSPFGGVRNTANWHQSLF